MEFKKYSDKCLYCGHIHIIISYTPWKDITQVITAQMLHILRRHKIECEARYLERVSSHAKL